VHYIFIYKRLERNGLTYGDKGVFQKSRVAISANVLGLHNAGNVDIRSKRRHVWFVRRLF